MLERIDFWIGVFALVYLLFAFFGNPWEFVKRFVLIPWFGYDNQTKGNARGNNAFPLSNARETETEAETEAPAESDSGMITMKRTQFDRLLEQAKTEGGATVFGRLLGAGYLDAVVQAGSLTQAKQTAFSSPSGRVLSGVINPAIATAQKSIQRKTEPTELRTMTIRDGRGEREIEL